MPITFHIDPESQTIHSTATGTVVYDELLNHLNAKKEIKLLNYAELFDARDVQMDLSMVDLHLIARNVHLAREGQKPAPIAVVTNSNFIRGLAKAYAALTSQDNSAFEVFSDIEEAKAWIRSDAHREVN